MNSQIIRWGRRATRLLVLGTLPAFVSLLASPALAAQGDLLATLENPEPQINDEFGYAVAAFGTTIAVGAPLDQVGIQADAGTVYLYADTVAGTVSAAAVTIENPNPANNGYFGVALASVGGNLIIGAPGNFVAGQAAGRVYIYDTTGAQQDVIDNPTPVADDQFGLAVASIGSNILVGAPGVSSSRGEAYLFDGSGALLLTMTCANPVGANFGWAVAGVGGDLAIGAPGDGLGGRTGGLYLYDASATGTVANTDGSVLGVVNPLVSPQELWGAAIASFGSLLLVGAPGEISRPEGSPFSLEAAFGHAYLVDPTDGSIDRTFVQFAPENNDHFGLAVDGTELDTLALIGSPGEGAGFNTNGRADAMNPGTGAGVFELPNGAITLAAADQFGFSVAGSGAFRSVIGAPGRSSGSQGGAGQVFVFEGTTPVDLSGFEID